MKYHFAVNYDYGHVLTSVASNGICQFHIWTKLPHLFDYLTNLQSKLVRWRDAQALKQRVFKLYKLHLDTGLFC